MNKPRFFEFFAGGGMARAGLGADWECAFANDFDPMKGRTYATNWGGDHLKVCDINSLSADQLPGQPDLIWASFPCQDLSLAGNALGLGTEAEQTRSGAFWALWRLVSELQSDGRPPSLVVLENVYGALTSNGGRDFATIARSLSLSGYRFGALLIDGVHFVPQSRPRIFIVAILDGLAIPQSAIADGPIAPWHPPAMSAAINRLSEPDFDRWLWLRVPDPNGNKRPLDSVIEDIPTGTHWHSKADRDRLIGMMSSLSLAKLHKMQALGKRCVGTIYKRTRANEFGQKVQRAELRDDQIAGCLRTPSGGSSRQYVVVVNGSDVRTRLLSPREAARLMGLDDSYQLPPRYNDAYHVAGDGLVVPAVRYLAENLLEPIISANSSRRLMYAAE